MAVRDRNRIEFAASATGSDVATLRQRAIDIWTDLAFDDATRRRLGREGLRLDEIRLSGPFPYVLSETDAGSIAVRVVDQIANGEQIDMLVDLWDSHFALGLRNPAEASQSKRDVTAGHRAVRLMRKDNDRS